MENKGPIILIEDDIDDQKIFAEVLKDLNIDNSLKIFKSAEGVIDFLLSTPEQPFIIISDINLPGMNGIELRKKIDANEKLRKKSIPFIFYTTSVGKESVDEAYKMMVQGYFQKPHKYKQVKENMQCILHYWDTCKHPNTK